MIKNTLTMLVLKHLRLEASNIHSKISTIFGTKEKEIAFLEMHFLKVTILDSFGMCGKELQPSSLLLLRLLLRCLPTQRHRNRYVTEKAKNLSIDVDLIVTEART